MKLIFLRHGTASSRKNTDDSMDDYMRELVSEGKSEVKKMVNECKHVFKGLDVIYTSPLPRAVQTAQLLYKKHHKANFEFLPALDTVSGPKEFINELFELKMNGGTYCFVGHEPILSSSINLLLNRHESGTIDLAKGGIAVLEGENFRDLKLTALISPDALL